MNESFLIDFYEFTMAYGYFKQGFINKKVTFDLFFRHIPDEGGYALMAGLESIVQYIKDIEFTKKNIDYLRSKDIFDDDFLAYLESFEFTGDIYSVKEGTVIFPNEPVLIVHAPIIQAQLMETFILQSFNHQSLIATKASRIKRSAGERTIIEMGARRAHGSASSNLGARAAYIGGSDSTSNTMAGLLYKIPVAGTMAHSWVQSFDNELDSFTAYARIMPDNASFLVDTYDTINSGVPNAIKVIKEELHPKGIKKYSVRLDSGDLSYLSKRTRHMLDDAGLHECKIIVSSSLDEYVISSLIEQGAPIDIFGVGERLITAGSDPILGGVYKLSSVEQNGEIIPKIKRSHNPDKITIPHFKKVYRIYDKKRENAYADLITVYDENIDDKKPLNIFDPVHRWQKKIIKEYTLRELLIPIFINGRLVYDLPSLNDIKEYCKEEVSTLWDEIKRFKYPHKYYVDLSKKLGELKAEMINKSSSY